MQPFWNLAVAPVQVQALELALEHDLFALLAQPSSTEAIAAHLQLHLGSTQAWLELLWGLQLLEREAQGYRSSALANRWFSSISEEDCRAAWRFRAQAFAGSARSMASTVTHGPEGSAGAHPTIGSWASAATVQIGQEQQAITVPEALHVLHALDALPARGRILDLGGGPGWVAIALAQACPLAQVVVFDLPQPVQVAANNIARAGLQARVEVIGGDLDQDAFGTGYDLVWCSSVLHFVTDPAALLHRIRASLNPGGRLLIVHAERPSTARDSAALLPFYLPMLLRGSFVPEAGQTATMLTEAGFSDVQFHGHARMAMAAIPIYSATRP